jgi:hypothetical protein
VRTALVFLVVAWFSPRAAHAGRSFYGWLYGTEVMPERGVELQTWISDENGKYGVRPKESSIWWGPLIGVTDQLELSLPIEMEWTSVNNTMTDPVETKTSFTFRWFGIEARYRLASPDPIEAPPLVPLVRVAVKRDVSQRDRVRAEGDVVASYEAGAVHAQVDVGFIGEVTPGGQGHHTEIRPGGGVSVRVSEELRVGAEGYAEISFDSDKQRESWAVVGPNVAWTHGRFWFSGAFGIGVYHIKVAPRVVWGIAF